MRPRVSLVVAALVLTGCATPEAENRPEPSPTTTAPASPAPSHPASVTFPPPRPARPRIGEPFTAAILADGGWIKARVTLTAIDTYRGRSFPELDGTPLLFRWKATNIDDHVLTATSDPVSYRFSGLDELERRTVPSGYAHGADSPAGCTTLPDELIWKPRRTVRGCSVQTVRAGARFDRAAFLSGDVRNPHTVEFDFD